MHSRAKTQFWGLNLGLSWKCTAEVENLIFFIGPGRVLVLVNLGDVICILRTKTKKRSSPFDARIHCGAKKLHRFIFAITLLNLSLFESILVHIYLA